MPLDYRIYEDAQQEYMSKKSELEKAIAEGRPELEIEKLKGEVKEAKEDADWKHSRAVDIW